MADPNVDSDLRDFYFYFKYLWSPADFEDLQKWLRAAAEGLGEGAFGAAALSGLLPTPAGGLNVSVDSGIAVDAAGRLLILPTPTQVAIPSPSGNPAWNLIVLRAVETDTTLIPEPQNPSNNVPLHKAFSATLLVLPGTPSPSPSRPPTQAGDLVLAGVKMADGQASVAQADMDRQPVSVRRKAAKAVRIITQALYLVQTSDEHIEQDCSAASGVCVLPSASQCPGQDFTFVKVDSGSFQMAVSGTDGISGMPEIILEDQWQTVTVRSNGLAYRVV